jgi:hypothetical protein
VTEVTKEISGEFQREGEVKKAKNPREDEVI